jgi:D-lactate dehydrogenase (cytochrome)
LLIFGTLSACDRLSISCLREFSALAFSAASFYVGSKKLPSDHTKSTLPLIRAQKFEYNVTSSNLTAAYDEVCTITGKENVSLQESDLSGHSGSEWSSYTTKATDRSNLIIYPASTEEVAAIMKVCHQRSIPVTPFSGGTSLEGNFAPTRGGICIDFARMHKIIEIHPRDLDVVVQPGVGWEELNEELAEQGLFFPPDPGPGAKIGGMIGTGCSGTNAYRYGTMREWVLSLTVVLADGTVIKTRQRPRKSSAGYDLTKIIIGSEGTLGLVTEATLKITVLPQNQRVAVASFNSVYDASECVTQVVAEGKLSLFKLLYHAANSSKGVALQGIEILDDVQMRCINQSKATTRTWQEKPTLFFKFAGTPLGVKEQMSIVQQTASNHQAQSFEFAHSDEEAGELWSARKEALWSVIAMKRHPDDHVWTTDVAVPISRLPDIIVQTKEDIKNCGLVGTIVGHVGDGNFHAFLLFNGK